MGHIVQFVIHHGYLVVFVWLLAEQAALPIPSVPLLLACGALARNGQLNLILVVVYGVVACLIADNMWFQLGRWRGARVLRFICRISLEPDSCVRQTEDTFVKYGMRSLLVTKFVPGLNSVAAPLAGSSGAGVGTFLLFDCAGALVWIMAYMSLGYLFSDQLETVAGYALRTGSSLVVAVCALVAGWIGWKILQRRRFLRKLSVARITPEELRDKLEAGEDVLIVDVRSSLDTGIVIPNAIRISAEDLAKRHHEIPRDRDIILFCT
jgi:membrane protein DedA with SNARE-associated domain